MRTSQSTKTNEKMHVCFLKESGTQYGTQKNGKKKSVRKWKKERKRMKNYKRLQNNKNIWSGWSYRNNQTLNPGIPSNPGMPTSPYGQHNTHTHTQWLQSVCRLTMWTLTGRDNLQPERRWSVCRRCTGVIDNGAADYWSAEGTDSPHVSSYNGVDSKENFSKKSNNETAD